MPTIIKVPKSGVLGMPSGRKRSGIDFDAQDFLRLIEEKGVRLAWSRAADCPCASMVTQADQSDYQGVVTKSVIPSPNCSVCSGEGILYFRPSSETQPDSDIGQLDEVQAAIASDNASVIRGSMAEMRRSDDAYQASGRFVSGHAMVTVRPENKLGYYDRLINLDSEITYREIVRAPAEGQPVPLKFKARGIHLLATLSSQDGSSTVVQYPETSFEIADGLVTFVTGQGPTPGERVTAHYLTHPSWIVMSHPHAVRSTVVSAKTPDPITPVGNPADMPLQAELMLEFLAR